MSAAQNDIDDSSAPLIEHLAELRNRLIYSALAFLVGMIICFTVSDPIFNFLSHPVCNALETRGQSCSMVMIKLQEGFFVAIRISFVGGFALSFPVIGYQMWRFIAPGLYRTEKNAFLPFLIASPAMFLLGAAFAYYVILPMAFQFFLGFQQGSGSGAPDAAAVTDLTEKGEQLRRAGIIFQGSIEEYLSLTIKFIMAFGLCFQLPVLLTLMGKAGLISSEGMASVRKYAIVGILVLAAVVTPPDVFSQIVLFAVVYGLYEISILLVRMIEKKRAEVEAAEEAELMGTPPVPPTTTAPAAPATSTSTAASAAPTSTAPVAAAAASAAAAATIASATDAFAAGHATNPVETTITETEVEDEIFDGQTEEEAFEAGLDEALFDELDLAEDALHSDGDFAEDRSEPLDDEGSAGDEAGDDAAKPQDPKQS